MEIKTHQSNGQSIAEVISDTTLIATNEDGLDLLGNLYYQGFDRVILHKENIAPPFFDLKTGMAGEILQKFANYRMRLVIVGEFELYESKSLRQFIMESNKGKQVNFLASTVQALEQLSAG